LRRGTPLPSVRQLAGDLDIAPNTVVRVYEELERAGLIISIPRKGFQVASIPAMISKKDRLEHARMAIADLMNLSLQLGLDVATVRADFERQAQGIEALRTIKDTEQKVRG
jgi:GntR family transcriptional regulator